MIVGIGIDLIEVDRVARCIIKPRFLDKVYTVKEQEMLFERKMNGQTAAGIFASKEAVSKALGTGFGPIHWTDIEILKEESGRPYVVLHGIAHKVFLDLGGQQIWLSITHTRQYAAAQVVLEG